MPNFDSGTYFLTALLPVDNGSLILDDTGASGNLPKKAVTSPVHALRKELARLAPAQQSPQTAPNGPQSPFARNLRTHFARFVVIDDTAFVGRKTTDAVLGALLAALPFTSAGFKAKFDPIVPQPQDHLANSYLFFSVDFDATGGETEERDSYLRELWSDPNCRSDLRKIFKYCFEFEERVRDDDPQSFANYIADCQLETTMPFHDYFPNDVPLDALPPAPVGKVLATAAGSAFLVFAVLYFGLLGGLPGLSGFLIAALAGLGAGGYAAYRYIIFLGGKPLPAAPNATLRDVLKALHVKAAFTRFAIDNQMRSADPDAAKELYDRFGDFVATHKPQENSGPTQKPGIIGI